MRRIQNSIKVSSLKWDCEAKEGNRMPEGLGAFLVSVVLMFIGVFLMISAYLRNALLLKLVSLGTIRIDPDSPGRKQRAVVFDIGVTLVVVGLIFVILDKLNGYGVF